jgi:hypothetical protein
MSLTHFAFAIWVGLFALSTTQPVAAQDCRIYTAVSELRSSAAGNTSKGTKSESRQIVGRNLSLFHGGKVYDYLETLGEVTVYEPAREEFTLISRSRMKIARVSFAELQRMVDAAEERAAAHCLQLSASKDPLQQKQLAWTRFQLAPDFRTKWDATGKQLRLSSPLCEYRVDCTTAESPSFVETYTRYADWTARLNYLLHPQALAPQPRLRLNAALRQHQVLPLAVELTIRLRQELRLVAEHKLAWKLEPSDRGKIHDFERMSKDEHFEPVSFDAFQRATLLEPPTVSQSSTRPPQLPTVSQTSARPPPLR